MLENGRMGNMMVKGHTPGLMEKSMLGNGRMELGGMELHMMKMGISK